MINVSLPLRIYVFLHTEECLSQPSGCDESRKTLRPTNPESIIGGNTHKQVMEFATRDNRGDHFFMY